MFTKLKEAFKKFKTNLNENLVENEEGAELVEIIIGIALVAMVLVAVILVITKVNKKGEEAGNIIDDIDLKSTIGAGGQ